MKANEFFNPDTFPDEVIGFSEELTDAITRKSLGSRRVEMPTRPLGAKGWIEFNLVEDTVVTKGLKTFTIKASPSKPRKVMGMLIVLCGRHKENPKP